MSLKGSNYPTIRPSLDLQFAQTKRLDPRISYSRSGVATYIDETGILRTAQANEARFDHDPVTGESLGLLVEEARTNSQPYSSKYDTSHWGFSYGIKQTPNATVAPDGTLTATLIQQDTSDSIHQLVGGYEFNSGYITINSTYTLSLYVKYYNSNKIRLMEQNTYGTSTNGSYAKAGVIFNFETESIEKTIQWNSESQSRIAGYSVDKLPNGWYRLKLSVIPGTDSNNQRVYFGIYPQEGNLSSPSSIPSGAVGIVGQNYSSGTPVTNFIGDGSTGVYIWGAQVETGSFPTSYIPTPATFTSRSTIATYYDASGVIQTAGIDVARDNAYFPDENGVFKPAGLLLEAAGTNLMIRSEEFDNSHWVIGGNITGVTNVTANQTSAPNGITADLITLSAVTSRFGVGTSNRTSVAANAVNTLSVFVKAKELDKVWVGYHDNGGGTRHLGSFNLSTRSWYGTSTFGTRSYQALANGWFRLIFTFTPTVNGGNALSILIPNPDGTATTNNLFNSGLEYNGTSYSGQGLYVWGAQLETGPRATSYIPTSGSTVTRAADVSSSSTVTRAADVASISGAHFNPLSSTFVFTEASFTSNFGDRLYATLDGTNGSNRLFFLNNFFTSGPSGQFTYTIPAILPNGSSANYALTFNYDGSITEKAYAKDGVLTPAATMSGLRIPTTGLVFNFGANNSGMIPIKKTFKRITYYPVRLPDATLQKLTQ